MTESQFKARVFKRITDMFPGCEIVRGDSSSRQGVPDHFIFWGRYWAALEFKRSIGSRRQPNQDYFIEHMNYMSFAAYIYPENEEEVLRALEKAFRPPRPARVFKSKSISLDTLHSQ